MTYAIAYRGFFDEHSMELGPRMIEPHGREQADSIAVLINIFQLRPASVGNPVKGGQCSFVRAMSFGIPHSC